MTFFSQRVKSVQIGKNSVLPCSEEESLESITVGQEPEFRLQLLGHNPHMPTCPPYVGPHLKNTEDLERVQGRSRRGLEADSYEEQLKGPGLFSLKKRRLWGHTIATFQDMKDRHRSMHILKPKCALPTVHKRLKWWLCSLANASCVLFALSLITVEVGLHK